MDKILEELHELVKRDILVEVEHVKAHRTKKEKENMKNFERFATEGNEKADEGFMAEARGGVCCFAVCGKFPLFSGGMERL